VIGFLTILIGMLADLIGRNRQLSEEILLRVRRLELASRGGDERPAERPRPAAPPRRRADGLPR
jgi:hypothetical protein